MGGSRDRIEHVERIDQRDQLATPGRRCQPGDQHSLTPRGTRTDNFRDLAARQSCWPLLGHGEEPGLGIFVFRERATGRFVGRGALRRIEIGGADEVEVGYAVAADVWGHGLATEMAAGLAAHAEANGLRDLVAYTEPSNAASRRVMEKVGFHYERDVDHHGRAQVLYRREADDVPAS